VEKNVIIYIGGFELPDKNAAAQRCVANSKIFRELGYEVVLLGIDKNQDETPLCKQVYFGFSSWSVPYPKTVKQWLGYIVSTSALKYIIENKYKNRVHSIVCYNYPAVAQFRIKKIAKNIQAFCIADATEWYGVTGNNILHKIIKWLDTILRMKLINKRMDGLITTSPFLTKYYKNWQKNILELPTLYDRELFEVAPKIESSNSTDYFVLMYAGSPFDVKSATENRNNVKERLDIIIDSMSELNKRKVGFQLKIFGVSKEEYLKVYPEHIEELEQLNRKIRFYGRRSFSEIISNIRSSDFTIFLRDENRVTKSGFPSKFSESISYGVPVITNKMLSIEPYISEGKNGFLVELDLEELVSRLAEILVMDKRVINRMKEYCISSEIFDFRSFVGKAAIFLNRLG